MDVYNVHHLETIFPDSHTYNPQRFIDDPGLEKYMVAFSRGSRACIGINLAQAELFSCVSRVFRVFGGVGNPAEQGTLELFETTEGDVRMARDMFIPTMMDGTKGVRVMVKE
jgi:cytochrome P450